MRIAHVVPDDDVPWSGVLTVIVELAAALAGRGHQVELWRLRPWDPLLFDRQLRLLADAGVTVVDVVRGRGWRAAGVAAGALERDRRPDLVHLHGCFNPAVAAFARGLHGVHAVSPHGGLHAAALRRGRLRKAVYAASVERRTVRAATVTFALTAAEARQVARLHPARIEVVPNGVRLPDGPRNPRPLAWPPVGLFVGRLDVLHKGLDDLLRGLADAPAWHAVLTGPDHRGGRDALLRQAADLGITDRLDLTGPLAGADLERAFAGARAFLLPSRWEGMPMALLEAMARGLPALVSPAVEEAVPVAAGGAGWVSSPAGIGATLRAMAETGDAEWAGLGDAAVRMAAARSWASVSARYEAAYERATGVTRRRGTSD